MDLGNSEEGACTHVAFIAACTTSRKKEDKELFLTKEDINLMRVLLISPAFFFFFGCSMKLVES